MTQCDSLPTGSHPRTIWTRLKLTLIAYYSLFLAGAAMETQSKHYDELERMNTTRSTHDLNKCQCLPFSLI